MKLSALIPILVLLNSFAVAQKTKYPPNIEASTTEVYKSVDGVDLRLWIFNPPRWRATDSRPAIVFFFGGGWRSGTPAQFVHHCEYLAARGMVAMVADYRVASRHGVKAAQCLADAKSAIRWIRSHAEKLGVDPQRIAAGGGSAGGHLAAATALIPGFDDPQDDTTVSAKPNALVLFNPAVVLAPIKDRWQVSEEKQMELRERMGTDPVNLSPYHHITGDVGPCIIFHGIEDTTVPFKSVDLFRKEMRKKLNRCELVGYHGEGHGFFNWGKKDNALFVDTVSKMDQFLCSLGYLEAPPESIHQK